MTAYFGFTPSETLQNNIETALRLAKENTKEPLYLIRDQVSLGLNDELIDIALTQLARMLPPSDKKETMEKLSSFIRSTMQTLLKQLLGKEDNTRVLKSISFLTLSTHTKSGTFKVGCTIHDDLIIRLKSLFAQAQEDEDTSAIRLELIALQKQLADQCIKHFITDFCASLDLGFFKRNAMSIAQSATTKAIHFAIHKLVPSLNAEELEIFAKHYDSLLYLAD
ncbi:MAG: hypothetical protein KGO49_13610 [Gammaproteobacteria bacterium]|nr:hypothetical protein [Gammaproteobacteria bacterium]